MSIFRCPECEVALVERGARLACPSCNIEVATVDDGMTCFNGCADEHNFFEKQAIERLDRYYAGFDHSRFAEILEKAELWQMDEGNKRVGIARKFWWEGAIGKFENKSILELGCGVNYLVPYFLESGNDVLAFDICRESVEYSRKLLRAAGVPLDRLTLAVADARKIAFAPEFDVVNISNVLHHIDDKPEVFRRAHKSLKDDGKMIIVEPNYYYPPRWAIETDALDPLNFVKNHFVRNDLIEEGEKAIIFRDMVRQIRDAGFKIDHYQKDRNYLGYFTVYWMKEGTRLARTIYNLDQYFLSWFLPRLIAPFEYIIASKA